MVDPARRFNPWHLALGLLIAMSASAALAGWAATRQQRWASRAVQAGTRGDWAESARLWDGYHRRFPPSANSWRDEAAAALAAGRAAQAERALRQATAAEPNLVEPWLLRLEICRVEDRALDALRIGWAAYEAVPPTDHPAVLRGLTLALLADTPEDLVRASLTGWIEADPDDLEARLALLRRQAAAPRDGDPTRAERIVMLDLWLREHPGHPGVREALVLELADAGEPRRGWEVLEGWPAPARDARYDRLLGRWKLDYQSQPGEAVEALRRALQPLPHDWRTRYRLARALEAAGHHTEAMAESVQVNALREALDPASLGPRLDADLQRLEQPEARIDLSNLCRRLGLTRLAGAWTAPER